MIFGGLKENDFHSYQTLVLTFNDLESYLGKNPLMVTNLNGIFLVLISLKKANEKDMWQLWDCV